MPTLEAIDESHCRLRETKALSLLTSFGQENWPIEGNVPNSHISEPHQKDLIDWIKLGSALGLCSLTVTVIFILGDNIADSAGFLIILIGSIRLIHVPSHVLNRACGPQPQKGWASLLYALITSILLNVF